MPKRTPATSPLQSTQPPASPDVLVMGGHPCGYLAATLLRGQPLALRVAHVSLAHESHPDRLVLINAEFFSLSKLLSPLQKKLKLTPIYGLRFLADDAETSSEYRSKTIVGYVAEYAQLREAMRAIAKAEGVDLLTADDARIKHIDENGARVTVGKETIHPKSLVVAAHLAPDQQAILGIPDSWGEGILHRHTFALSRFENSTGDGNAAAAAAVASHNSRPTLPMSLDLKGTLSWGWMLQTQGSMQISISQPVESIPSHPPTKMLQHWANVLHTHAVLKEPMKISDRSVASLDLPLSGALAHEGVANRTLLIGPAGGFYSACSEDIYPNCWSAVFAAETIKKALKEKHLQDALNAYRFAWRTTLGDYLRGPQQNLRFLLPLVYRNQVMTARLSESILMGKSVVR